MAFNPAWHAEYRILEAAEETAREVCRTARRALDRKPSAAAQARYDVALEASRAAGKARWDFEMTATVIVRAA